MPHTTNISCNHCGQANDRSATYCAGCNTRLRGFPDDAWIPRALIAANLRTELQLPCMPCRTRDAVDFSASSGNAPEVKATFETGPDVTAPCDLGSLLASFAQLGTDIRARLAFGARMETLSVARAIGFDLQVEMRDPTTSALIASGSWSGKRIPNDGIALALRGERPPASTVLLVARLRIETAEHGVRELRSETRSSLNALPRLGFNEGPVRYLVPLALSFSVDPVACLKPDFSHQLSQTESVPQANRSSSTPREFEAILTFREAGTYHLWFHPDLMQALDSLEFSIQKKGEIFHQPGVTVVRVATDQQVKVKGSIVPRLLASRLGTYDAQDYAWRFDIRLEVCRADQPTSSQLSITVAVLQLWAARRESQAVAIDFGTSATSIRVMRERPNPNDFKDEDSIEAVIEKLNRHLCRPSYGSFQQTAHTALRIEQHPTDGRVAENVTVGASVVQTAPLNTVSRSVTLLKRLLANPNRAINLSERDTDVLGVRRTAKIRAYSAFDLAESFLQAAALDLAADGCLPDTCRLSYPATWNGEQNAHIIKGFLDLVQRAFQSARAQQRPDLAAKQVVVSRSLSEPEALLFFQLATSSLDPSVDALLKQASTIAVVDVGGGTTDVALVRPRQTGTEKREVFPVLSEAFNLAGEDITHAIASAIWLMLQATLNPLEGTREDRPEYATIRRVTFPDFSHQRFNQRSADQSDAVGFLNDAYMLAERFKLGVPISNDGNLVRVGEVALGKTWDPERLGKVADQIVGEIVNRVVSAIENLAVKISRDSTGTGPVTAIIGGNATRYIPLRNALRDRLKSSHSLGGPVTVVLMEQNAKDGVAMGLMLKYASDFSPEIEDKLPFQWSSEVPDAPVWRIDIVSGDIPLQSLSTEAGELKILNSFAWKQGAGFEHMRFHLHRIVADARQRVDISPGAVKASRLWDPSPLPRERMKRGRLELLAGDVLQITFTDLGGEKVVRAYALDDLFTEFTT